MAKKSEKNIRKLRKNYSWIIFVIFGGLVWFVAGFVQFFVRNFGAYIMDSKLSSEYETICYMARLYEQGLQSGNEGIYTLLNAEGRPYLIKDADGNIIYENGKNTCSEESGRIKLYLFSDSITVYSDRDQRLLYPNEQGTLSLDDKEFMNLLFNYSGNREKYEDYFISSELMDRTLIETMEEDEEFSRTVNEMVEDESLSDIESLKKAYEYGFQYGNQIRDQETEEDQKASERTLYDDENDDESDVDEDDEDDEDADEEYVSSFDNGLVGFSLSDANISDRVMQFPIWMSAELGDGQGTLVAKAYFRIGLKDLMLMTILIGVVIALIVFVLIVMLVNAINSFTSHKKMTRVLFTDVVTRGHNWMYFQIKGEQMLRKRSSAKYNYAVLNLFFVKYSNFCVCHSIEEGEQALCKISEILNRSVDKKEMSAHVSTSNYALILHYESQDELKMRIQRILSQLEQIDADHKFGFQVGVNLLNMTTDANGNPVRRKNLDIEQEYNNACAARATLSDSDDSGIAFFDTKLVEEQKWIDIVQEQQRKALENEEFQVYYQPKYDPRTKELRGAEALIRWESPEYGFITPGRFIPIFEKNGFITEIDHYMIQHVAKDQKAWLDQGYQCVPVSVNVSRAHFIESDLAEQIRNMIDEAGCPHELVEIELTESAFFDDKKAMINTISKLKSYGFAVSMDDFGSGYSSLNSLKDMPLDVLKLDAEFFRGESEDGRGEIVVTEAIKLAKSLNMRTVAEGVEVKEQVDFLAEQGCDMIQGYYFSKPVPKEEYQAKMRA